MRLELARTFQEAIAMLRAGADVLSAVAGMFILMPGILSSWFATDPPRLPKDATMAQMLAAQADWVTENWFAISFNGISVAFGSLAIMLLLLDRRQPTVGEALRLALRALPIYIAANVIQSFAVLTGTLALVLPGFYIFARLLCTAPVAATEGLGNPIAVLRRSLELTRGNGWRILAMLLIVLILAVILSSAIVSVTGVAGSLLLPPDLLRLLVITSRTVVEAALTTFMLGLSAAIYRRSLSAA